MNCLMDTDNCNTPLDLITLFSMYYEILDTPLDMTTIMPRGPIFSPTSLSPESGSSCCLSFSLLTGPVTVLGLSCFLETVVHSELSPLVAAA
jgi:hypothetical protein